MKAYQIQAHYYDVGEVLVVYGFDVYFDLDKAKEALEWVKSEMSRFQEEYKKEIERVKSNHLDYGLLYAFRDNWHPSVDNSKAYMEEFDWFDASVEFSIVEVYIHYKE